MSQTVDLAALLSLANQVMSGKEYFVSTVLGRLDDAADTLPHDGAVRTAQRILQKRLEKEGSLATITQRQFSSLYDDVCALGNRTAFREMLGDLLITAAPEAVAHYNSEFTSGRRDTDDVLKLADDNMVGEFSSLWGNELASTGSMVDNGRRALETEFTSFGFGSPAAEVVARSDEFVMFSIQADSPIGRFTAYVPAEIKQNTVLMPSVFASANGFSPLTKDNLLAYAGGLVDGTVKMASPQKIMAGLSAVADAGRPALAVKLASGDDVVVDSPSLYQTVSDYVTAPEANTHQEYPKEMMGLFTNDMRDALVEAGLGFDKNIVITAKTIVSDQIKAAGLRVERISVESEFDGGLVVSAGVVGQAGKRTLQVPVEVISGQVLLPSVFMSGVVADAFTTEALRKFASTSDAGIFNAAFSNKSGWAYRDLYTHAIKSAAYGNFVEAEDAMAVIAEQYGPEFHRAAFRDLSDTLNAAGESEPAVDAVERMIAEAGERARNAEDRIKMSSTLMYLIPED